ncbi:MAG: hypothetical protein IJS32_07460 [Kiritimatiellae bacterium]|nr:hypothetical protein [Kiritimatiellia bacterium]
MRGDGQKAVILMMREEFLRAIDEAYPLAGFSDRASFIRAAVFEFLEKHGVKLAPAMKTAPSRGGRKPRAK